MAYSQVYVLSNFTLNADTQEFIPAIRAAVNTSSDVQWEERASNEAAPVEGDPVLVRGTYPNANEFPVLTAATSPTLAPAACRHLLLGYKVSSGDPNNYVTSYNETLGAVGAGQILDWLAVWYPAIRNTVSGALTETTTRIQAINILAQAIQPGRPTIVE